MKWKNKVICDRIKELCFSDLSMHTDHLERFLWQHCYPKRRLNRRSGGAPRWCWWYAVSSMSQRAVSGKDKSFFFVSLSVRVIWAAGNRLPNKQWHKLEGHLFTDKPFGRQSRDSLDDSVLSSRTLCAFLFILPFLAFQQSHSHRWLL